MWLIGLAVAGFLLASLILPWILLRRVRVLEEKLRHAKSAPAPVQRTWADEAIKPTKEPEPAPRPIADVVELVVKPAQKVSFERRFGTQLPVWVGGIALALAGLFLVKYSIENQLITESLRVTLGAIFGVALVAAAQWVHARPDISNGRRIAQALAGAGVADLYLVLYAATNLYGMVSPLVGFAGMAAVTVLAVGLALRQGPAIAVLGLLGGLLTPALVHSDTPNAALLFAYLFLLVVGLFELARYRNWLWLAVSVMAGSFVWALLWLAIFARSDDMLVVACFLLAVVTAMAVRLSERLLVAERSDSKVRWAPISVWLAFVGASLMMAYAVAQHDLPLQGWGMLWLLAAGSLGLAYQQPLLYRHVPRLTLVVSLALLLLNQHDAWQLQAWLVGLFAALFAGAGYFASREGTRASAWAWLSVLGALGGYLVAYATLNVDIRQQIGLGIEDDVLLGRTFPSPLHGFPLWGAMGVLLAYVGSLWTGQVLRGFVPEKVKQEVLAATVMGGFAFLAVALTIELPREFLSVAIAMVLFGAAWLQSRLPIVALRRVVVLLGVGFAVLLIPQILLLMQITAYSLVEAKLALQQSVPIVDWPLFQLGLPAVLFIGASILLRRVRDDRIVQVLEVGAIALIGVMGYYLTRHAFHPDANILFIKAGFFERGVTTNVLLLFGIGCYVIGHWYDRAAVRLAGTVLVAVAAFRIFYFDVLTSNPLWNAHALGEWFIANALLLPFGLPVLWLELYARAAKSREVFVPYIRIVQMVLLFLFVSLNVTQLFHGNLLEQGETTNAEVYAYSVAWLLLGLVLLFVGTLRQEKSLRIASLLLMLLTVGKVFLYDADELTGLYRVFSFFGLGVSLIGLSWFYSRFVFGDRAR